MRDLLKHLFFPHHTNNHRPKVLHHEGLAIIIVFILGLFFSFSYFQKEYPSVLGISINVSAQDLVNLTNQKRAEAGLPPLNLSQELSNAAAAKANYMLEKNFWAHVAPDGTTPWYFIKSAGYEYQYAGENLARGFNSAPEVVEAWMASPTHRDNLISSNYKDVGFAVATGTLTGYETVLVVQVLGSRYSTKESSVAQAVSPAPVPENTQDAKEASIAAETPKQAQIESGTRPQAVAAVENKPLVDSKSTQKNISFFILVGLVAILIVDLIVIERKKVARTVAHNIDHVIFLGILLLAAIIIGGGAIL